MILCSCLHRKHSTAFLPSTVLPYTFTFCPIKGLASIGRGKRKAEDQQRVAKKRKVVDSSKVKVDGKQTDGKVKVYGKTVEGRKAERQ